VLTRRRSMFGRKEAPLRVVIPRPEDDKTLTPKVGVIAVIGFVIGVVWPRLVGFHVGPTPPESGGKTTVMQEVEAPSASGAGSSPKPVASDDTADAPKVSNKEIVVVAPGEITSCVNKKGDRISDCGPLTIDKSVEPKLKSVGDCAFGIGLDGEVDFALNLNFEKSTIDVLEGKRKAPWPVMTTRGLLKCAADELKGLELDKIAHTHPRYTVEYHLTFYSPGKGPDDAKPAGDNPDKPPAGEDASLGRATVVYEKGLLRETPKDGKIVARLPQGTRVKLQKQDKDWYFVTSGSSKGWIHRQAIGK
jgi:hypothetical protein